LLGNPESVQNDWIDVTCDLWQLAISTRLDGEDSPVDSSELDAHVASCGACREYLAVAESTRRAMRVRPAPSMPDLSRRVAKRNAIADRAASWSLARALLAVVALEVIGFSLKTLIVGDSNSASAHTARHLGAFSFAYGIGLLVVVVRPARARAILPVATVLAAALVVTAAIDVAQGHIPFVNETTHLPELISVVLIWLLAVPAPRRHLRRATRERATLRSVKECEPPATRPRAARR